MSYKIGVQKNSAPFDLNLDLIEVYFHERQVPKKAPFWSILPHFAPYWGSQGHPLAPFLRCAYDYIHGL